MQTGDAFSFRGLTNRVLFWRSRCSSFMAFESHNTRRGVYGGLEITIRLAVGYLGTPACGLRRILFARTVENSREVSSH